MWEFSSRRSSLAFVDFVFPPCKLYLDKYIILLGGFMKIRQIVLCAALFLLLPISASAVVSESWEEPPLQAMRSLPPVKKLTCGNVSVTTTIGEESGRFFDLRTITVPKAVNFLHIVIYHQAGKDKRVAYYTSSVSLEGYTQKSVNPSVFENDIFSISFQYAQHLLEESDGARAPRLHGKKWCAEEAL